MDRSSPLSFVLMSLAGAALGFLVFSCVAESESSGGIFGDRPVESKEEEEEDASSSDATSDARVDDEGTRDASAPPDAAEEM